MKNLNFNFDEHGKFQLPPQKYLRLRGKRRKEIYNKYAELAAKYDLNESLSNIKYEDDELFNKTKEMCDKLQDLQKNTVEKAIKTQKTSSNSVLNRTYTNSLSQKSDAIEACEYAVKLLNGVEQLQTFGKEAIETTEKAINTLEAPPSDPAFDQVNKEIHVCETGVQNRISNRRANIIKIPLWILIFGSPVICILLGIFVTGWAYTALSILIPLFGVLAAFGVFERLSDAIDSLTYWPSKVPTEKFPIAHEAAVNKFRKQYTPQYQEQLNSFITYEKDTLPTLAVQCIQFLPKVYLDKESAAQLMYALQEGYADNLKEAYAWFENSRERKLREQENRERLAGILGALGKVVESNVSLTQSAMRSSQIAIDATTQAISARERAENAEKTAKELQNKFSEKSEQTNIALKKIKSETDDKISKLKHKIEKDLED